jgi:hypothetical protein
MTESIAMQRATLWELDKGGHPIAKSKLTVQFNPETLKLSYSNQVVSPTNTESVARKAVDQNGSATMQFVGKGTTKLTVQLWFDVTGPMPPGSAAVTDVRTLTTKVVRLVTLAQGDKPVPPAVLFAWGTFQFNGIVDSVEESLEFFSSEGVPLRASINLSMAQQGVNFTPPKPPKSADGATAPGSGTPGTRALTLATAGQTLQGLAAAIGLDNWQAIAAANNIDNPRLLSQGELIDMLE